MAVDTCPACFCELAEGQASSLSCPACGFDFSKQAVASDASTYQISIRCRLATVRRSISPTTHPCFGGMLLIANQLATRALKAAGLRVGFMGVSDEQVMRFLGFSRCRKCGYSLIGNTSGRCPECGTLREPTTAETIPADEQPTPKREKRFWNRDLFQLIFSDHPWSSIIGLLVGAVVAFQLAVWWFGPNAGMGSLPALSCIAPLGGVVGCLLGLVIGVRIDRRRRRR